MEPQRTVSSGETRLRGTVLVVDDDEATCELLGDWVRMLGFDVMAARSAHEALELMRHHTASIAFCDIVMPGRDGVWLIDQLGRHFPQTAVIIATGLTKMEPSVTLAPCVTAYLVKPFHMDDVAAAIGSAMDAIAES
jgi:DNA-binding NtrC family response regulator